MFDTEERYILAGALALLCLSLLIIMPNPNYEKPIDIPNISIDDNLTKEAIEVINYDR